MSENKGCQEIICFSRQFSSLNLLRVTAVGAFAIAKTLNKSSESYNIKTFFSFNRMILLEHITNKKTLLLGGKYKKINKVQ